MSQRSSRILRSAANARQKSAPTEDRSPTGVSSGSSEIGHNYIANNTTMFNFAYNVYAYHINTPVLVLDTGLRVI